MLDGADMLDKARVRTSLMKTLQDYGVIRAPLIGSSPTKNGVSAYYQH